MSMDLPNGNRAPEIAPTYTVRPAGAVAWAGPGLSAAAAVRAYEAAKERGLQNLMIIDDFSEEEMSFMGLAEEVANAEDGPNPNEDVENAPADGARWR